MLYLNNVLLHTTLTTKILRKLMGLMKALCFRLIHSFIYFTFLNNVTEPKRRVDVVEAQIKWKY